MARKASVKPVWWKNTFFWFALVLILLAGWGAMSGERVIRDPGQVREGGLVWIYAVAAVVMVIHGFVSHQQAVQHYAEATEEE